MSGIPDTLAELAVDITTLKPYPSNARRGDIDTIKESLRVNGQYRPVVVNRRTMEVLAGNHTLQAAQALEWTHVAATFVDATDEQARRIVLIDNRANDIATYDDEALAELLQELDGDFAGTGFDAAALDELMSSLSGGFSREKKDAAPDLPADAVTQPGDVIELGRHTLICGDSLDPDVLDAALGGCFADLLVTDPPYMVSYGDSWDTYGASHHRQDGKKVANDNLTGQQAIDFIDAAIANALRFVKPGGCFYVFSPPGDTELDFRLAIRKAGEQVRCVIVWVKDKFVFGRSEFHYRHEVVMFGWRSGAGHFTVGDRTQDTIWEYDKPARSKAHPTMKPVEMLERMIENNSRPNEIVLDPFGGSGSTLIACETTGRSCATVELDPRYCDVIVERYENLTGHKVR